MTRGLWDIAAAYIDAIILILPDAVLPIGSREPAQFFLGNMSHISSSPATIFLRAGRSSMEALEASESCRGILTSLTVDAKSDIAMLKEQNHELWDRYTQCRNAIARISQDPTLELNVSWGETYGERSHRRHKLFEELQYLRSEIRKCPGLERFLQPPTGTEIFDLAKDGPLVSLNIDEYDSHALLVTMSGVEAINLPHFDYGHMKDWVKVFNYRARAARRNAEQRDAEIIESDDEGDSSSEVAPTKLSNLWHFIVKPILEKLEMLHGINPLEELPRIWWVGGGIMSLMPLHAAGDHSPGSTENTLSHAVCSYIPTLKMLQFLRSKPSSPISLGMPKLLIVSMPITPGGYQSLNTAKEADAIIKHSGLSVQVLHLARPSRRKVVESLPSCLLAHFACHGKVNLVTPGQSSLILGENTEEYLTVDEMLDGITHTGGQFAYLSACSTAEIDTGDLIHESIHLASAFQLAGFQQVIGTLWRADDNTAVALAGKFYELLFQKREITGKSVAYALHAAVVHCRDTAGNVDEFLNWAPFVHLGT